MDKVSEINGVKIYLGGISKCTRCNKPLNFGMNIRKKYEPKSSYIEKYSTQSLVFISNNMETEVIPENR